MKVHDKLLVLASAVALAQTSCATLERNAVEDDEALLAASGFTAMPADSSQGLDRLDSIPPHKLVSQKKDDQFVYVYADPDYCRCVYVGGPQQYTAYKRLAFEQEIGEESMTAALDWDTWGGW